MANNKLPKGIAPIALVMVLGTLPPMLDSTIINVAVNSLVGIFSTTLAVMQWVVTGYVLAMGVAVPFSGWLAKKIDEKTVFMSSLGLFLLASLLAGVAWSVESLIIFRIIQGFATGILLPTMTTMLAKLAGGENLGKVMSLISIPIVFCPIIGPVIGGLILQYLPWNWLFLVNIPVGIAGLICVQWKMPRFEADDKVAKLDWPGVLLLAIVSGTLIYGVTRLTKADSRTAGIVFLAVGACAFIVYVVYAFIQKEKALIALDIFKTRNFTASFLSLFLAGFATNGPMLLLPLLFQNVRGLSVIISALWLLPQGVGMLMTRPLVGRLADQIGAKFVVLPSIILIIIGTVPFVFVDAGTSSLLIWVVLLVRGAGLGGFTISVMSDSYVGLPKSKMLTASVAARTIQNVGSAFGTAVLSTVVSSVLATQTNNLTGAYHAGFITSLIFMAVGILPALFLSNKLKNKDRATAE